MKTRTKETFFRALNLLREGRKLSNHGLKLRKAGFKSGADRERLGEAMVVEAYYLLGKVTEEGWANFLAR